MEIQWPLLLFSLMAGCGGALFACVGVAEAMKLGKNTRFIAAAIALALVVAGGCFSVLHLAHPGNIMAAAANIFSFSGISVELIMIGVNVIVIAVYLLLSRRESSAAAAMGYVGIVCGLLLGFVTGNGYVMQAQPLWNTFALPLAYLGSDIAMGVALFATLLVVRKDDADFEKFKTVLVGGVALSLVLFLVYGAIIGFAVDMLTYWVGAVLVGGVAACACAYLAPKNHSLVYASLAGAVVGGVCIRAMMWIVGTGFLALFSTAASHGIL